MHKRQDDNTIHEPQLDDDFQTSVNASEWSSVGNNRYEHGNMQIML